MSSSTMFAEGSSKFKGHARQVNESVYELHKPSGNPSVQIVFFHGLYTEDSLDAHVSTWESEDGLRIWPATWLVEPEEFPTAHVLSVSYCGSVGKSSQGSMDMHNIVENLISDLMEANIGQSPHCPVVLVGYCFGGLVIKQLCCQMSLQKNLKQLERDRIKLEMFFENLRGIFNYGTPHSGCFFIDKAKCAVRSPLLDYFNYLNQDRSRLNHCFDQLYRGSKWLIGGLGESLPAQLGILQGVIVGSETSARHGDNFNVLQVEHFSICRPGSKKDRRFYAFTNLLHSVVENEEDVHKCQGLPRFPIDLENRAQEVQGKLMSVEVLGLVGMGGIGKTTLAKQVFNYISREFEYTCFVDNVKGIPKHELENSILGGFYQNGRKMDRSRTSWSRLKGKTLIIMDDVNSQTQVQILPALESLGIGSRLVITSQDESVLNGFDSYELHKVDFLEPDQAEKLFCQYAKLEGVENLEKKNYLQGRINLVVKKCGGLPLTLEVMGCYLRGHTIDVNYWEETIEKLNRAQSITGDQNDRVWAALSLSYEGLAPKEQEMFIEASIYFFGDSVDTALAAWSGVYGDSKASWENLMSKSLVKEVSGTYYYDLSNKMPHEHKKVWVHEHLRDLVASLSEGYMVSVTNEESTEQLNANEMNATARIVRIGKHHCPTQEALQSDSLVKFRKLRYLDLNNVKYEGSFGNFPRKLSLLRWWGALGTCLFSSCSHNQINNLAVLELSLLHMPKEFPKVLGRLTNLRILSLQFLSGLDHLPETFGDLQRLKQLRLQGLNLQGLPSSFGCLSSLEDLALSLPQLACLPDSFCHLRGLTILIVEADRLQRLPDNLGLLACLEHLTIHCRTLKMLPDSLGELIQMKTLHLDVPEVKILPGTVGKLCALREMCLISAVDCLPVITCHDLEKLPDNLTSLCSLESLKFQSNSLESLPESIGRLSSLKICSIESGTLRSLPDSVGQLSELSSLTITCKNLEKLPDSFGSLSALKQLTLEIGRSKCLPSGFFSRFKVLQTLVIRITCQDSDRDSLETLRDNLGLLSSLENLTIDCPTLKMLPDSLGDLARLQTLCLDVKAIRALPATVGHLSALREMEIKSAVDDLPESLGQLTSLKILRISSPNLKKLPYSFQNLRSLENLHICSDNLEIIPESIGLMSSLRICSIRSTMLRSLPDGIGKLSAFHTLTIEEAKPDDDGLDFKYLEEGTLRIVSNSLERLPECIGQLSSLETCSIQSGTLKRLPDSIGDLARLQTLYLDVKAVKVLPATVGHFSALRGMVFRSAVDDLPESLGQLTSLKGLRVSSPNLKKLPYSFQNLRSLESLLICSDNLEIIPESIGLMSSLRSCSIQSPMLRSLPDWIGKFSAFYTSTIEQAERHGDRFFEYLEEGTLTIVSNNLERLRECH